MPFEPSLTPQQKTEISDYINAYRAKHQSPPLVWDDTIATFSQQWSYHLLTTNDFSHSGNTQYGENLAYYKGYGTDTMTLLKKSIDAWYNEVTLYNFARPGFSSGTGHFTCLVWKSSTNYALGISIDLATSTAIITMNTSPPGNISGKYQENVLPLTILPPVLPPVVPPVPTTLNKTSIVYALYNIINAIQFNQSRTSIIALINTLIAQINAA
jgi:hypothetical protein